MSFVQKKNVFFCFQFFQPLLSRLEHAVISVSRARISTSTIFSSILFSLSSSSFRFFSLFPYFFSYFSYLYFSSFSLFLLFPFRSFSSPWLLAPYSFSSLSAWLFSFCSSYWLFGSSFLLSSLLLSSLSLFYRLYSTSCHYLVFLPFFR